MLTKIESPENEGKDKGNSSNSSASEPVSGGADDLADAAFTTAEPSQKSKPDQSAANPSADPVDSTGQTGQTSQTGPDDQPSHYPNSQLASAMSSSKNILSNDVEIHGNLKFSHDLIIDGKIDGDVTSDGSLTIGENARMKGQVQTKSVTVFGKVEGNITVTDRCELKSNAELLGDIKAGTLSIEEGATFMGTSTVGTGAAAVRPAAASISTPAKPKTKAAAAAAASDADSSSSEKKLAATG